jgi:site-specific recombinase XerC
MDEENKTPMMLTFMFGEAAKVAQRGASERLLRWCRAYDEWLAERRYTYRPNTAKQSVLAWRRLVQQCGKTPWELTTTDIEQHAAWMQAEGYSPATIGCALGIFSNFYRWCSDRRIDPECEAVFNRAGFNPAEGVRRPKVRRYGGAKLLSREEVGALLRTMQRDSSELGKRDYAFTLARMRLGAPLSALQQLKWGQIEHDAAGVWVRWRAGRERCRLPEEAWEAMRAWLKASGRLAGMRREDYIFVPLVDPLKAEVGGRAEDWAAGRCLSNSDLLLNLKLYGRLAGIEEGKLTLMALRRTATRLRLDEGASLEEMQVFLDSHEGSKAAKYRLGRLPELPPDEGGDVGEKEEGRVPVRKGKPFKPGEGVTHGFYARSRPAEAVVAVLKENIQGMGEEIVGLRILARGMLERAEQARSDPEAAQLGDAYSLAALRLGEIIKGEKDLAEKGETSQRAEEFLEAMDRLAIKNGGEPVSEKARAEALGGEPELEAAARRLVEEVAGMRYCLRRAFRAAIEAADTRDYIHYGEIYSSNSVRLMKMLRMEGADGSRLDEYITEAIQQAIKGVMEEMGLEI